MYITFIYVHFIYVFTLQSEVKNVLTNLSFFISFLFIITLEPQGKVCLSSKNAKVGVYRPRRGKDFYKILKYTPEKNE